MTALPYTAVGEPVIEKVPYNGVTFKTVTWKVPQNKEYKGKIIYVHGFCEHSTIYTEFFDSLSQDGYEVFFFDQRGAGETSPGKLFGKTDEFHTFDDLDFMIKRNLDARTDKNEKFFLAGHSMGGGISLNYGIHGKYREHIKGIFVSGPLVVLHPKTQPNVLVRTLQPVINALVPNLQIDSKLNYDYLTSHEGYKEYIKTNDKKLIGSIRQFNDMFNRGERLTKADHASKFSPDIRLLILHGDNDNINWIQGTRKFVSHIKGKVDVEFIEVSEGRHSLFIEKKEIYDSIYKKVVEFLDQQL